MSTTKPSTRLITRLHALLAALQDGPVSLAVLRERLQIAYPTGDSARRMLERDLVYLAALGIHVERTDPPPGYLLRGGSPCYTQAELRTLALIRDSFDAHHPQFRAISLLLERLTANLTERERQWYAPHTLRRAPVRPAIDYAPYADLIDQFEQAILVRQPVRFTYRPASGRVRRHDYVEPYAIEFYERHFYLVAYSSLHRRINDFRLDRISDLHGHDHRLAPGLERTRPLLTFRYRLDAALAQGELSQRFEQQRVLERLPNGDLIIEAQGRSDFFIIQTLLRYRAHAELLDPPELRARMIEEVRALAELYATGEE
ncbi:MAG: helix-turn-helix transcriptional regulator [Oscillochloridaceae bacterium umkhey_bin13]